MRSQLGCRVRFEGTKSLVVMSSRINGGSCRKTFVTGCGPLSGGSQVAAGMDAG